MLVLLVDCPTVWTLMVFVAIVSVDHLSCRKPIIYIFDELLMIFDGLLVQCLMMDVPYDELSGRHCPLVFVFKVCCQ
jgi:hypothetical protein